MCVRPDHLFLGTVGDNTRDAAKKGRLSTPARCAASRGERNPRAKLTEGDVREIRLRRKQGESYYHMARVFGLSRDNIRKAAIGITWTHVGT